MGTVRQSVDEVEDGNTAMLKWVKWLGEILFDHRHATERQSQ
jgi:hypothetical protein